MVDADASRRWRSSADGWRGLVGESFTPGYAAVVADSVLRTVTDHTGSPVVLVTYDGRESGEESARAVVASAIVAGARRVRLVPHLPTPIVTAAVRRGHADLAFLVTASHNPAAWNGLKVKVAPGAPMSRSLENEVNRRLTANVREDPHPLLSDCPLQNQQPYIVEHLEAISARRSIAARRSVVVDGLGGVAGEPMASLCEMLGWQVTRLGCIPEKDFGGVVPDPSRVDSRSRIAAAVQGHQADFGIVVDGDGDRIYLIDERGRALQSHELLALLYEHNAGSSLAVTVSTGAAARLVAGRVVEVPIGFKHLAPLLAEGQVEVAGGGVGDMAFAEFGLDRDPFEVIGLWAKLLEMTGSSPAELLDDLHDRTGHRHWFETHIPASGELPAIGELFAAGLGLSANSVTTVDGLKYWFDDDQWLLLRNSSTEGGLRIYGEVGDSEANRLAVIRAIADVRRRLS